MGLRDELTRQTNHLMDWGRPGALFFSHHQYSAQEWLERGFVLTSSAAMGFLNWMQTKEGGLMPFAYGAGLGFLLSHTLTMSPLIHKRLVSMWNFSTVAKKIKEDIANDAPEFIALVNTVITQLKAHEGSKSASAIWGKRERLINNLCHLLATSDHRSQLLENALKSETIIEDLSNPDGYSRELKAMPR